MTATIRVVPEDEYTAWMREMLAAQDLQTPAAALPASMVAGRSPDQTVFIEEVS
jgi:heme/copper-type cytochrome/quinol oxidase subunit 2